MGSSADREKTATDLTREYLTTHAAVRNCLQNGLINYSALARQICQAYQRKDAFEAVLIACRRYRQRLQKRQDNDRQIIKLMQKARIRVRTRMLAVTMRSTIDFEKLYKLVDEVRLQRGDINVIAGQDSITVICDQSFSSSIRSYFGKRIVRTEEDLAQIVLVFDQEIERVPGVVAYFYGLLYETGVNVLEEMSCWRDLMVVLEEEDLPQALRALSIEAGLVVG